MKNTTIYIDDVKKNVYSTTDKLYLAYGNHASGNNKYLTVGKNSSENDKLNNGLRIDNSYWINKYF